MKNLFYLFIILALFSCDTTSSESEEPDPPLSNKTPIMYIPLEEGNFWVMGATANPDTMFMRGDTLINGEIFFGMDGSFRGYNEEGMIEAFLDENGNIESSFLYKFPPITDPGMTYIQENAGTSTGYRYRTTLISADSSITTQAGLFSTYVFRTIVEDAGNGNQVVFTDYEYFAPGVGLVRLETDVCTFCGIVTLDLRDFHIGSNPYDPNSVNQ